MCLNYYHICLCRSQRHKYQIQRTILCARRESCEGLRVEEQQCSFWTPRTHNQRIDPVCAHRHAVHDGQPRIQGCDCRRRQWTRREGRKCIAEDLLLQKLTRVIIYQSTGADYPDAEMQFTINPEYTRIYPDRERVQHRFESGWDYREGPQGELIPVRNGWEAGVPHERIDNSDFFNWIPSGPINRLSDRRLVRHHQRRSRRRDSIADNPEDGDNEATEDENDSQDEGETAGEG